MSSNWIKVVYAKKGRKTRTVSDDAGDAQRRPHLKNGRKVVRSFDDPKQKNTNVGIVHAIPKDKFRKAFSKALSSRRRSLGRWLSSSELSALARSVRSGWNHSKASSGKAGVGYIPTPTKKKSNPSSSGSRKKASYLTPLSESFVAGKKEVLTKPLFASKVPNFAPPSALQVGVKLAESARHKARLSLVNSLNRPNVSSIVSASIVRDHLGRFPEDKKAVECFQGDYGNAWVIVRSDLLFPITERTTTVHVVSSGKEVPSGLPSDFREWAGERDFSVRYTGEITKDIFDNKTKSWGRHVLRGPLRTERVKLDVSSFFMLDTDN